MSFCVPPRDLHNKNVAATGLKDYQTPISVIIQGHLVIFDIL